MWKSSKIKAYQFVILNTLGWLLYGAYSFGMGEIWSASDRHQLLQTPFTIVAGFSITYLLRTVFRITWTSSIFIRLLTGVPAFLFSVWLLTFLGSEFNYAVVEGQRNDDPKHFIGWAKYNLFVLASWSGIYLTAKYFLLYQGAQRRTEQAEALAQKSRLEMLRYQLNPHFLFNTLNAINTLILDKQNDTAAKTLSELSRFLRFSLDATSIQWISLEQEVNLLKDYINIESIRFGDRFNVEINLAPESLPKQVPPMLLQPLVENTIKYAVQQVEYPITLSIKTTVDQENLIINVFDNGPGASLCEQGYPKCNGIGLHNIQERLGFYFAGKASCRFSNRDSGGFCTELILPANNLIGHDNERQL